jgi:hypothetical protein
MHLEELAVMLATADGQQGDQNHREPGRLSHPEVTLSVR